MKIDAGQRDSARYAERELEALQRRTQGLRGTAREAVLRRLGGVRDGHPVHLAGRLVDGLLEERAVRCSLLEEASPDPRDVALGAAEALGEVAAELRAIAAVPRDQENGRHRAGSLPFLATQEHLFISPELAGAERAGLSEAQVIDVLARLVEDLQGQLYQRALLQPPPTVVVEPDPNRQRVPSLWATSATAVGGVVKI